MRTLLCYCLFAIFPLCLSAQSNMLSFRLATPPATNVGDTLRFEAVQSPENTAWLLPSQLSGRIVAAEETDERGFRLLWFVLNPMEGLWHFDEAARPLQLFAVGGAVNPAKIWKVRVQQVLEGACAVKNSK